MQDKENIRGQRQQALGDRGGSQVAARLKATQDELEAARATVERLQARCRHIEQQMQAKNLFLARLSHELRTPLNSVIGFADLLASGAVPGDSPKREQFLKHIQHSGQHLLQLIDNVLELSKVEAGLHEFTAQAVDLHRLIADVADLLQTRIVRKGLALDIEVDPALGTVVADPVRLKQALMTYLSNAVKFTRDASRVTVCARPLEPGRFRLEVTDEGPGIDPEAQPRAFEEFAQPEGLTARPPESTGLSLALTRRMIEAQGGEVGLHSTPGVGSTFYLVLDRVHSRPGGPPSSARETPLST